MAEISRARLARLMQRETERFAAERPKSRALFERAGASLLGGVPMNWMVRWSGPFPLFVREARGPHFTDVDGHRYLDLCLGDTGAMTGHSPEAVVEAVTAQVRRGVTYMLPTEDSVWVGEELQRRFGLPAWQIAMTATDANRFAIRLARGITGRKFVLVFNGCYHGTVDETFISLRDGRTVPKKSSFGPPVDPAATTRAVEFNDPDALERALLPGDVACVLAEPAMTNVGMILPEPGYHEALRDLTRRTGTLLIVDETHTICAGPGGYTAAHGLKPDILTIGKPIAGGVPAAAYGVSADLAGRAAAGIRVEDADVSGIGGTLSGNALALAAMRATLERVLTPRFYEETIPLAERFTDGVTGVIRTHGLPWHVVRLGNRAEYQFRPVPSRNGSEAEASMDLELERFLHLYALNRGILMTPFHNMALIAPGTTVEEIDGHTRQFGEAVRELIGETPSGN
ncbi:MAG TPA: aspartate aminotransferase family protein [Candidatus Polarisedimenticolia bacterium]|nr:aspartate aminotransferase family protein [Candidatus Polarisedimenticolia bacterium]